MSCISSVPCSLSFANQHPSSPPPAVSHDPQLCFQKIDVPTQFRGSATICSNELHRCAARPLVRLIALLGASPSELRLRLKHRRLLWLSAIWWCIRSLKLALAGLWHDRAGWQSSQALPAPARLPGPHSPFAVAALYLLRSKKK